MVPRADRNASYLCQLANPSTDLPSLYNSRLTEKHIQQIPRDADQIMTRTLLNQPTKPMLTKMKVRCDQYFHALSSAKSSAFHGSGRKTFVEEGLVARDWRQERRFEAPGCAEREVHSTPISIREKGL
jgi:hypothetical protein